MTPKQPVDMAKVELLRKHMLIRASDLAMLCGVSRVTYYSWLSGKAIRPKNADKLKRVVRKLIAAMQQGGWPSAEVTGLDNDTRFKRLLALLEQY